MLKGDKVKLHDGELTFIQTERKTKRAGWLHRFVTAKGEEIGLTDNELKLNAPKEK